MDRGKLVGIIASVLLVLLGLWWGFAPREEARLVHLRWLGEDSILVGDNKQEILISEQEVLFWQYALLGYRGLDGLVPYAGEYYYQPSEEGVYWIVTYKGSFLGKREPMDISPFIVPPEERLHLRYLRHEYPYEDNCFSIERFDGQVERGFSVSLDGSISAGFIRRQAISFRGTWAVFRYGEPKTLYPVYPQ